MWSPWLQGSGKVYAWLASKNVPYKENQLIPHITEKFSQGHLGA